MHTCTGTGAAGYDGDDLRATATRLKYPPHLSTDGMHLFIVDRNNGIIRSVLVQPPDMDEEARCRWAWSALQAAAGSPPLYASPPLPALVQELPQHTPSQQLALSMVFAPTATTVLCGLAPVAEFADLLCYTALLEREPPAEVDGWLLSRADPRTMWSTVTTLRSFLAPRPEGPAAPEAPEGPRRLELWEQEEAQSKAQSGAQPGTSRLCQQAQDHMTMRVVCRQPKKKGAAEYRLEQLRINGQSAFQLEAAEVRTAPLTVGADVPVRAFACSPVGGRVSLHPLPELAPVVRRDATGRRGRPILRPASQPACLSILLAGHFARAPAVVRVAVPCGPLCPRPRHRAGGHALRATVPTPPPTRGWPRLAGHCARAPAAVRVAVPCGPLCPRPRHRAMRSHMITDHTIINQ